ncbi:MAG: type II toxin-antitoxin system RelE/ParE family toxin [Kiritimatiellae bacterium]|nr:type II toxin-antitoxin system RelE/ParE family toxin [Kiritimatiellia bacterium]
MCVNKNWTVEYTDEFETWWVELAEGMQDDIDRVVMLLEEHGPTLGFPYSSAINGTRFAMRELRIQSDGHPIRILYAFDPARSALLLIGGDKTGNDRWYIENVPKAERIFEEHLKEIKQEDKS